MIWFTSTPVSFSGGLDFFCRDSGLICKGLQSAGLSCKSVMPLPSHPDDITEDLIRTEARNLMRPEWWNSIGAEKVVLYSWGHPKYIQVARAIQDSGAKVFINLDNSGIMSPKVVPWLFRNTVKDRQIRLHGQLIGTVIGVLYNIVYPFYIPCMIEPKRIMHLRAATAIGCITPPALSLWRQWARIYAPELIERMHLVPNPVADYVRFADNTKKEDSVVAVGRWDDIEPKRPSLLARAIELVLKHRGNTVFHIYGNCGPVLSKWYSGLSSGWRKRVTLHGRISHKTVVDMYIRSRVGLCSSSHEGSHVASEEALCAGATVIAPMRPELNAMLWYTSFNSGRLSVDDSAQGLAEALLLELETWDRGERDPKAISDYWHSIFSVSAVVDMIGKLLS